MPTNPIFNFLEVCDCSAPDLYFSFGLFILNKVRYHLMSCKIWSFVNSTKYLLHEFKMITNNIHTFRVRSLLRDKTYWLPKWSLSIKITVPMDRSIASQLLNKTILIFKRWHMLKLFLICKFNLEINLGLPLSV